MTKLPLPSGSGLIKALGRLGFRLARVKGSHHILRHPDGRKTVVPVHGARTVSRKLLGKVLRQAEGSIEEYLGLI